MRTRSGHLMFAVALLVPVGAAVAVPVAAAAARPAQAISQSPAAGKAHAPQVEQVGDEQAADLSLRYTANHTSWRQEVRHPGATYIKVHFAAMMLAAGDRVTVADSAGREVRTYRGDPGLGFARAGDADVTRHGRPGFAAMSIEGEVAVVTLHAAARRADATALAMKGYGVRIDGYWRGFDEAEILAHNPGILSVCGTDARRDAVCYRTSHPTEYTRSRAVAKLLIGGGGSCTTWRVGRTNRMLTNKHCISSQSGVQSSEVQFNFDCATCGGNDPGPGTKVSGAQLFRVSSGGSSQLDYTLYSVNSFDTIASFGTLFLETRAPAAGERIYIPGHGSGRPKRISIFETSQGGTTCTVRSASYNTYNMSYSCDTSGGNSGSPVLAGSSHRVIALHHLGGCPNNQGARMHLIYPQIRDLIDNG